jgi:hypothetical protein
VLTCCPVYREVSSVCAGEGSGFCARGGVGSGPTTTAGGVTASPGTTPAATARPAGCSSLGSILSSCSRQIPNVSRATDEEVAECACFNAAGSYVTSFDNYAKSCASWYRTAQSTDYSLIAPLTTFCSENRGLASPTSQPSSTPRTTSTRPPQSTVTVDSGGNPISTSSSRAGSPSGQATSGPLAWLGNWVTFVLGFFILL